MLPVDPSDFRSHGMAACTQQGPAGPSGRLWYGTAVEHSADMRRLENRERPLRTMATTYYGHYGRTSTAGRTAAAAGCRHSLDSWRTLRSAVDSLAPGAWPLDHSTTRAATQT